MKQLSVRRRCCLRLAQLERRSFTWLQSFRMMVFFFREQCDFKLKPVHIYYSKKPRTLESYTQSPCETIKPGKKWTKKINILEKKLIWEAREPSSLLVHSTDASKSLDRYNLKSGVLESIQASYMSDEDPTAWFITCHLPGHACDEQKDGVRTQTHTP